MFWIVIYDKALFHIIICITCTIICGPWSVKDSMGGAASGGSVQ